jgi:hypothetical protein
MRDLALFLDAEPGKPDWASGDLGAAPGEMATFLRACPLLREHLDAITAAAELSRQPGTAVNTATGRRVTAVADSPEIFRDQAGLRLANIEAAARRALKTGGEAVIW